MGSVSPATLKSPGLSDNQQLNLDFFFTCTANVAILLPSGNNGSEIVFGYSAASPLTTAAIDTFTGNTNDILGDTCFAATAMGIDSMGFVINMNGQAASAVAVSAILYDATFVGAAAAGVSTALTNALSTALSVSALGNLYGRVVTTGFDAASGKILHLKVVCTLK